MSIPQAARSCAAPRSPTRAAKRRSARVYPGWYVGRTVHVHFKIFIDDKNMLTGQMYFPDALSQYIFANVGAYRRKVVRNVFNNNDQFALSDTTRGGFCDIKEEADHYRRR